MTTLVALSTKDAIVMGCDSLGSKTKVLLDPFNLIDDFFDPKDEWKLKTDKDGKPILQKFSDIYSKAQTVPFQHMTHVGKLFSLSPLAMGVMTTGIASIGDRTIKSLIDEFKNDKLVDIAKLDYTVKITAHELLNFVDKFFQQEYSKLKEKPELEFMIAGYDKDKRVPCTYRIFVHKNQIERAFANEYSPGIAFGGQVQEIQRIVFGTDWLNKIKLAYRASGLLLKYRQILQDFLQTKEIKEELPEFKQHEDELFLFKDWDLDGFDADWGDFSEQNAIECVNWFVEIMIKSQQFSSRLPTVGGDVHIGLITKDKGFIFISKEQYIHEGHLTPKEA